MYNKLFSKILDSSIWLAPDPHRLVWITIIAAMDEDGNAMFASAANLAARARVTREQAEDAIRAFEAPDPDSGDPDNEGRRVERFPGGWHVLNAYKYRALVTKAVIREKTRIRVAEWRDKQRAVTQCNTIVRISDAPVTPSEAIAIADKDQKLSIASQSHPSADAPGQPLATGFTEFWAAYPRKEGKAGALKVWKSRRFAQNPELVERIVADVRQRAREHKGWLDGFIPHAKTFLNGDRWEDAIDPRNGPAGAPAKAGKVRQAYDAINEALARMNHGGAVVSDGDSARDSGLLTLGVGGAAGNRHVRSVDRDVD